MKTLLIMGALLGGTGVMLGAFGAHALRDALGPERLGTWETAVSYHLTHALGVLLTVALARGFGASASFSWAGWSFVVGVLLFSGSLYLLALGGPKWLGPVTPIGGLAFIAGWGALLVAGLRS